MGSPQLSVIVISLLGLAAASPAQTGNKAQEPTPSSQITQPKRASTAPFEASKWVVTLTPDKESEKAGEKPVEDALTFEAGKMWSHVGKALGFAPVSFETGLAWARAEVFTPDRHSKCEWRVESSGDELKGTMVSTRGEGTIVNYQVLGKRAQPLEGTRWAIKLAPDEETKKDGESPKFDSIVFACGKFTRAGEAGRAVAPASYSLTAKGTKLTLAAETSDDAGNQTRWSAEFEGDMVKGSVRTTKKGGKETIESFEGRQMTEPRDTESGQGKSK